MKSLMMLFPNLVALCGRLMIDNRVPKADRALVAASIIYAIAPLDFLPDMIPFIGQIDDAYLISLTLLRLITRTDERIVKELAGRGRYYSACGSYCRPCPYDTSTPHQPRSCFKNCCVTRFQT
jgi:uncharacterized membrane protein YkvA (DUF1232 family)